MDGPVVKQRLTLILRAVFLIGVIAVMIDYNLSKPRVMILQSYGPDYSWTRDVDVGIHRVLGTNSGHGYWLRWHYMDVKRHPWNAAKQSAGIEAKRAIDDWQPNLIIAIDDDAQKYAAKFYVNRPDIKIVFAGTNGGVTDYGYDNANNVTGILERKPLPALREALMQIPHDASRPLRMMQIGDNSDSVRFDNAFVTAFDWSPIQYTGTRLVDNYPEYQQAILNAPATADWILAGNYRKFARSKTDPTLVPPEEVIAWTMKNSKLPMVSLDGFFVEDGGMLAIATSPFEQGQVAATMARQIIEKKTDPAKIHIAATQQFIVVMRPTLMSKYNVRLPPLYEAFARATNNYFVTP